VTDRSQIVALFSPTDWHQSRFLELLVGTCRPFEPLLPPARRFLTQTIWLFVRPYVFYAYAFPLLPHSHSECCFPFLNKGRFRLFLQTGFRGSLPTVGVSLVMCWIPQASIPSHLSLFPPNSPMILMRSRFFL